MAENSNSQEERIIPTVIEDELKSDFLDYAMSVIVSRALPDIRDGLKPVHRRVLYTMLELGLEHGKPYKKAARIVGDCLGKWHPHGDSSVYEALVRMAQPWSLRYPLIEGQGNFGCFTGDTQVKLTDGRNLSFVELIKENKEGKRNYTYTINSKKIIEIAEIKHPRLTKKKQKIIKIIIDSGKEIKCTLEHKFMMRNGSYKQAKELKAGDSLMPLYVKFSDESDKIKPSLKDYEMLYQPEKNDWVFCHILADSWNINKGIYSKSSGRIRHHSDFNKLNNNPDNIKRIQWKDHWKLHSKHASELHLNPEYRKKIARGRTDFWSKDDNRKKASQRLSKRNKESWLKKEYREKMSKLLSIASTEFAKKNPEAKQERSKAFKKLWQSAQFKQKISKLKSKEMNDRWNKNDLSLRRFTSEESKKMWSDPSHKALISQYMKDLWQDENYRNRIIEFSRERWKTKEYRKKFSEDHFKNMARKLWDDPNIIILHSNKAKKQWQNPEFKKKIIETIKENNRKRIQNNPNLMKEMAHKASISLKIKWQDPSYKEKVVRSRILNFVNSITKKYSDVTPEIYVRERRNNCSPRIETALEYFNNFSEMVEEAKVHNHKVLSTEILEQTEDVYDLTIDGTHNFSLAAGIFVHNSIDGDSAAAMRYTEARLEKISSEILADIEKETVNFQPNFDGSLEEPVILPSKLPNLLVNGSSGIAVGMATNIPPHNLKEVCRAIIMSIENPEVSVAQLSDVILGPDLPTGGLLCGNQGIRQAYSTGVGKIKIRAKIVTEDKKSKISLIVKEIPYMVNKSTLLEEIAELVKNKVITEISELRDESDRDGMRIVITLKKEANPEIVINQLYKHSKLEYTYGIRFLALVNNVPKTLSLKGMLDHFIEHRIDIITKRTQYELRKAEQRAHILEGLIVALNDIDNVIDKIRKSADAESAKLALISIYNLSDEQAKAILDMRLQRLASLEQKKIRDEHQDLLRQISEFKSILAEKKKVLDMIIREQEELIEKFGDGRKTEIIDYEEDIDIEDLIDEEDVVVTISHSGYIKRMPLTEYKQQGRGGSGVIGAETKEEDFIEHLFIANTHSYLLIFTSKGKIHWLKVYKIPDAGRYSKGKAIINLIELDSGEKISAVIPVKEFNNSEFLVFATKKGLVKKTEIMAYSNPRQGGIWGINLVEGDDLVDVVKTDGSHQLIIATSEGNAVRFNETDARPVGRYSQGVIGIRLKGSDEVIGMVVADESKTLLTVTENGYGKRTPINDYRLINRGGSGVINIKTNDRNGRVVAIKSVTDEDELLFISVEGQIIRTSAKFISVIGRNTQGVRLMRLKDNDKVADAARVVV